MKNLIPVIILFQFIWICSCGKRYNCNCKTYKKGTTELVEEKELFPGRLELKGMSDEEWKESCRINGVRIDSMNNYSTTTECIAF